MNRVLNAVRPARLAAIDRRVYYCEEEEILSVGDIEP